MRKLLNKPWFVAVMALGALALVIHGVFPNAERLGSGSPESVAVAESSAAATEDPARIPVVGILKSLPIPSLFRDPFALREKTEVEVAAEKHREPDFVDTVHLSAIWTQDGQTLVLINDRIFQDGDEIGRLKIESTSADGVWIKHWKGRDFLPIGGNFSLNTPADKPAVTASL